MNIEKLLIQLQSKYINILYSKNPQAIEKAIRVLQKNREKVMKNCNSNISVNIESLDSETKDIFELMEQYKKEIKQLFIDKDVSINHITDVSPKDMVGGKISRSSNRANNYETESGNWVFAASTPIDGHNPYIARKSSTGMIYMTSNVYIYGGDNIEVKKDENGKNHALLREPNYIYEINPANFNPVVTLRIDKNGFPFFDFSQEWVSDRDVDINDPNQVVNKREIAEITSLLENYQVLCDVNMSGEAMKIRSCRSPQEGLKMIREEIKRGRLRYINGETGVNPINFLRVEEFIGEAKKVNGAKFDDPNER